ncbi:MAG: hypothetical protein ACE5F1_01500 [Planctomycetota bacterium]
MAKKKKNYMEETAEADRVDGLTKVLNEGFAELAALAQELALNVKLGKATTTLEEKAHALNRIGEVSAGLMNSASDIMKRAGRLGLDQQEVPF